MKESNLELEEKIEEELKSFYESNSDFKSESESESESTKLHWKLFGSELPEREVVFFVQVLILYFIIISSIIILALGKHPTELWTGLLFGAIGILVPNPNLHHKLQKI